METTKNYLDNMFAALPKTARLAELKSNILANMEEKYSELKAQGKSENEAIGIVISEFGNIDELINELGIRREEEADPRPVATQEEVDTYIHAKKTMGLQIGIGAIFCILAPASLIFLLQLVQEGYIGAGLTDSTKAVPGLISLFILITVAVGLFIYSGMNFERYQYMEEDVQLPPSVKAGIKQQYDSYTPSYSLSVILSVCLLIASPIILIITSLTDTLASSYGVVILLCIIAVAVFVLIYFGIIREGYSRLLEIGEYSGKMKEENKVIGAVASIVWPLATLIFLFCGFVYHTWYIAWIVFPITGILFGMFSAAYSIITDKNKE